jgi:N-acetylmuramoyl-L-alanine amidase
MKHIKKHLILLILSCFALSICMVSAEQANRIHHAYSDDPETAGFIIIPHADDDWTVTIPHGNISLLGACDPEFPLYVNGIETPTTAKGFFTLYVELTVGENLFVFENGEELAELVVTRRIPEPFEPKPPEYFEEPLYGEAKTVNVSRFYERDDDNNPGTPLARGTVFQIIAEYGDMYLIHDGSFVFKNSVELLDERPEGDYCLELFEGDYLPLYSVDFQDEAIIVTIYPFEGEPETFDMYEDRDDIYISETFSGYFVDLADGHFPINLKPFPSLLSDAVVLLDAGHGGSDPGALGPPGEFGLMEKDFNLYVAEKTRDYLESHGINVIFLRDSDETFPVAERMEHFADFENLLDLAVSIHTNSMHMNKDFSSREGPEMYYSMEHSEQAANQILEAVSERTEHELVPAILRNFGMARYTAAPSMLFEMGFMCNPDDYERLLDEEYRDLIALSLGEGIVRYLTGVLSAEIFVAEADEEITVIEIPVTEPPQTQAYHLPTEPPARNPFYFSLGEILFLAAIAGVSVIRIVYEIRKG